MKNIVICSDGTGQGYAGTDSNVLRLYNVVFKHPSRQIACYDPGVGTLPVPMGRTRLGRAARHAAELAIGSGVVENVTELYAYLMRHYEPGDQVFLFGFSRGAFTVRALAGMLHVCGLLPRDDGHLLPYAAGLYRTSESRIAKKRGACGYPAHFEQSESVDHARFDDDARRFKSRLSHDCRIRFVGVWDTVKAYGWIWPQSFPALRHNPSVVAVRHAVSLDERRAVFQVTGWGDRHPEVKEVWFAGDHSDIGGGHAGDCPLADATLRWMLGEATHAGLLLHSNQNSAIDDIVTNSGWAFSAERHDLRRGCYQVLDYVPKLELDNSTYPPSRLLRSWPTGVRQPGQHHERTKHILLHDSVRLRGDKVDPSYRPENLLARTPPALGVGQGQPKVDHENNSEIIEVAYENDREIIYAVDELFRH